MKFKLQDKDTLRKPLRDCNALELAYVKINICMLNWDGWGRTSIILGDKLYIKKIKKLFSSVCCILLVFVVNKI